MTRFRHDLILRMIKLLDAVLVTIPFAMCWYLYYAKRVASPYYAKGDYLVVALFFVLFIIFGRVYDAFLKTDIKSLRESLKPQRAEIKQTEKEIAKLEAKKVAAEAKAAEAAKKAEAEDVLKKLLASGVTADEILEKLK